MQENKIYYYSHSVPKFFKEDLCRYGYKFLEIESGSSEIYLVKNNSNIIWYETQIDLIIDNIDIINNSTQKNVLIIDHHFRFHNKIQKLDELIKDANKVLIGGTQYTKNLYKNIQCFSMGSSDLWCHHDFIYYMIKKWRDTRQPKEQSLFLFLPAKKDLERQNAIDEIHNKLGEDILLLPTKTAQDLYTKRDEFDRWIRNTFNGANMLGGFGNGTPRFDLYDQVFGEIVIETVYDTPTVHVTEKTWKPIACGVPCLLITNAANIEYMQALGYDLSPKSFYDDISRCTDIKQAVDVLQEFVMKLKQDESLRIEMNNSAVNNYKKFWEVKSYWEVATDATRSLFGFSPVEEIEKRLKEI